MIYLIDDNLENQQQSYGCDFIMAGDYSENLLYLKGVATHERNKFLKELPHAATAVLFHATSKNIDANGDFMESIDTIGKVRTCVVENKIPYVSFSWGHTSHSATFLDGNVDSMNKRLFYLNFKAYIEEHVNTKNSDFNILVNGSEYKREILIEEGRKLIHSLSMSSSDSIQNDNTIKNLAKSFFQNSESQFNFEKYSLQSENSIFGLIQVVEDALKSIEKYGKDFYH
jgi:hypothetical protein